MAKRTTKGRGDFPKGNGGLVEFYAYLSGHYADEATRLRGLPLRRAEKLEAKAKELREKAKGA